MGVTTYSQEITSAVSPAKLFKALVAGHFIEGDGGVGSIKKTNFAESSHIKSTKHKIDAIGAGSFYRKYTMIESDMKSNKVVVVEEEMNFVASGSRSVCKMTSHHPVKKVCEHKQGKDKAKGSSDAAGRRRHHPQPDGRLPVTADRSRHQRSPAASASAGHQPLPRRQK